jgi:hypothetical protein
VKCRSDRRRAVLIGAESIVADVGRASPAVNSETVRFGTGCA